jgi:hypothetical protein
MGSLPLYPAAFLTTLVTAIQLLISTSAISSQVRIGFIGGVNFTSPVITATHSVLQPGPRHPDGRPGKEYFSLFDGDAIAPQFGLTSLIPLRGRLSLEVQLLYFQYSYRYWAQYRWNQSNDGPSMVLDQEHLQRFSYLELPVMLRYDFLDNAFSPFASFGAYIGALLGANKQMNDRFLPENELPTEPNDGMTLNQEGSVSNLLLPWNAGLLGGLGIRYRKPAWEVGLVSYYRLGLVQVADPSRRYSGENQWALNALDVFDDTFLHNLSFNLYITFAIGPGISSNRFGSTYCTFNNKPARAPKQKRKNRITLQ